ncbi:histone-lysine N-methyltransferase SUVR5 [Nicotiana sylvestris]|uniref:Histone-lysine N-methyltransferase SUVR5 n=1 Tax=Nicotiana sylvestris TaxID=4096 RepID=A0A1U7WQT1_NICSY|nr:PREDICTED: histone-lysine N-methyltransferase SUVR5 [Nicotiana sylvestris]XP_009776605.1 PREDICTED: histone-lysine N-methyltransferase SUVR5 [Nicotiana sylvestris]
MEVLPCSNVCYVTESDCPQQGSGTTLMYGGKSNHLEHAEQVQAGDVKVDDIVLNTKVCQEEKADGHQCNVEELPTPDGLPTGDAYYDFGGDNQMLSNDFHDSGDDNVEEHDHVTRPGLASERLQPVVDNIEIGVPNTNQVVGSSPCESKWLEEDEPLAVWVKWRGLWQAGIRCKRADWPLSTLKAKPTHERKKYLVIFFPRTRNYSWADVLLVRPINEFPHPIAYKTHKVGVKMVKDLTLAHRFIMQRLAVSILNIIDQLRAEALEETGRNVMVWKEFAMEVSRCKDYPDLGRMLLKLNDMILPSYKKTSSMESWIQGCQNANSAEAIEMLKEELTDSLLWNELNSLPIEALYLDLNSQWKNCRSEVMKWFSVSHPVSDSVDVEQPNNGSPLAVEFQQSRKRPKLEVRRAEAHALPLEFQESPQAVTVGIDTSVLGGHSVSNNVLLDSEPTKDDISLGEAPQSGSPGSMTDRWGEIIVQANNSEVIQMEDAELTPINGVVTSNSFDHGSKNRQCVAFIEAKGRQCVRWASDGDVYCCVHLASRFASSSTKAEASPHADTPMCGGTTVLGTKCKHRALCGSSFCKKHRPHDEKGSGSSLPESKHKRKHEDSVLRLDTSSCIDIILAGEVEAPLQVDPISFLGGSSCNRNNLIETPQHLQAKPSGSEMHCIGLWPHGSEPCLEGPKRYSLYCEKHLPSWLKRARNGKSRIISKEVFLELLKDCHSRDQKLHLHQACEIFYRLLKSVLSLRNPVPKEVQFQWAISEASKDAKVGEFLMKLVCTEKERLKSAWGFSSNENAQASPHIEEPSPILRITDNDQDHNDIIKCKICSEMFPDEHVLGTHWMDNHKKEAQWLFRGYACALCLESFTNKKVLEAHMQERHHSQFVENCMLFQCIPCTSNFGNSEELWSHVLATHPASFRLSHTAQQHYFSVTQDSSEKPDIGKSVPSPNINFENQSGFRKFICRFCGLKFDLLPDLGRHHQAAHMGPNSVGSHISKRGIRFYAYKLKSGRLSRPKFKKGLGSVAYRIRNRNAQNMKRRILSSNSMISGKSMIQPSATETAGLGRLADPHCLDIAKILFAEIKRTKPRPSNSDILSIARITCCKVSLQASLEATYGILPERMYLKAAKLCSEQNILVSWHQDGFICPKGCTPVRDPCIVSSLLPLPGQVNRTSSIRPNFTISEWTMDECHYVIDSQQFKHEPSDKTILLCDDISFEQESVPITCVVEENLFASLHILADGSDGQITTSSLPWESFTYVTKSLIDQSVGLEIGSYQLGCSCPNSACSSQTCNHIYLFDNDYEDAKDIYGKPMCGRFPYDERGRIMLEEGYLVYECNQWCSCSKSCQNRVLQNGLCVKLEIYKTETKGWAVRAREAILRGTFVCEYVGEVLDEQEANKRRNSYGREGCGYILEIDAHVNDMSRLIEGQAPYVIDATNYGNVSRYINHSCSPNLVNYQVLVESMDYQLAHVGFYASRDILAGEELTYNYRYKLLPGEGSPCLCGSSNCRGRLY